MHILDREGKNTLQYIENGIYGDTYKRTIYNTEQYEFNIMPGVTSYLGNRNRVIIQTGDGFFREFIIMQTQQFRDHVEVKCVGSQLEIAEDEPIEPQILDGQTVNTGIDFALQNSRWKRGYTDYAGAQTLNINDGWKTPLAVLNRIAAEYDLEMVFRVELSKGGNYIEGRYVDMVKRRGAWRGKEIVSGKDLINLNKSVNEAEVYTALKGIGPEREDGTQLEVTVTSPAARQIWGIEGQHRWGIYEPQSDNQDMTENQLISYTQTELNKRIASLVEYEVDAVDLEYVFGRSHELIRLGDTVRIKADDYEPEIYLEARIIEEEQSIVDPSRRKFKLGEFIEFTKDEITAKDLLKLLRAKANKTVIVDGQVIGEYNENFNMDKAQIGDIDSPSVPRQSQANIGFWVSDRVIDLDPPDDSAEGDSWDHPLRTVEEALRRTPKKLDHESKTLLAYDGDFWEYVKIDGYTGSGKIIIDGQGKTVTELHAGIRATGSFVDIEIKNMTITAESTYEIFSANAGNVRLENCILKGKPGSETQHGVIALKSARVTVIDCEIYGVKNACYAQPGANIHVVNTTGDASNYGLFARGGTITGRGNAPNGDVADSFADEGGVISPNFTFPVVSDPTPTSAKPITKKYYAQDSASYNFKYNSWDSVVGSGVVQGQDYGTGPYEGCWFFGSQIDELQGKTIKQMRIYCHRNPRSGSGGSVPIEFHAHTHKTKPAGNPVLSTGYYHRKSFGRDDQFWVTLPDEFYPEFENGYRKGIGIYSSSGAYARMYGNATLEVTYEE